MPAGKPRENFDLFPLHRRAIFTNQLPRIGRECRSARFHLQMRGSRAMAKKKSGGETKAPEKASSKGASKAAPKKTEAAAPAKAGAPKAAAKKGAEAPVKLTPTQGELLKRIGGSETGYLA